jgi:putative transposase
MTRTARIVIPGCPHHVTQRGNNRQTVFHSDSDRDFFLELKWKRFSLYKLQTLGFALLSNHTHDVSIPETPPSLAKGFGLLHYDFARWQNLNKNRTGHLWQERFFSCPLDEDHFWKALRYVELNPVRAGLVKHAWEWPWSSAQAHISGIDKTGHLNLDPWRMRFNGDTWREFLEQGLEKDEHDQIRTATKTGHPLGNEAFIRHLEELTGRILHPRKPGRKPATTGLKKTLY